MPDADADLACTGNGMWMALDALTIRRCVRDSLECSFPLTDLGGFDCEPQPPTIFQLTGTYMYHGEQKPIHAVNDLILVDVPLLAGVVLTIQGDAFVEPVGVWVGDTPCLDAAVRPNSTTLLRGVAYSVTWSNGRREPQHVTYGQSSPAISAHH